MGWPFGPGISPLPQRRSARVGRAHGAVTTRDARMVARLPGASGAWSATRSSRRAPGELRGGAGHGGGMGDSPLRRRDGEGRGDGVRRRSSASTGLRWPATSMGSSCSTRQTRQGAEAHDGWQKNGRGGAHRGGGDDCGSGVDSGTFGCSPAPVLDERQKGKMGMSRGVRSGEKRGEGGISKGRAPVAF
jgi:hypothetical protein